MTKPAPDEQPVVAPNAPQSFLDAEGNFKEEQPANTVRFTGLQFATRRVIGVDQWQRPDRTKLEGKEVKTEDAVVWDLDNKYTVDKSLFSKEQLEVLEADGFFSIT